AVEVAGAVQRGETDAHQQEQGAEQREIDARLAHHRADPVAEIGEQFVDHGADPAAAGGGPFSAMSPGNHASRIARTIGAASRAPLRPASSAAITAMRGVSAGVNASNSTW